MSFFRPTDDGHTFDLAEPVSRIRVSDESCAPQPSWRGGKDMGGFVSVRPCAKEYEGRTFLGIYLGDAPLSATCKWDPEARTLRIEPGMRNPLIFIPSRKAFVYGCESWWGVIESPEKLRQITDETIDGVWYVQAMKALAEAPGAQEPEKT